MSPMNNRLLRPRASGGFDPRRLPGLVQWYDAADQSTMTLNGTTVSEWRSKVGGVAVSQGTASAQPTLTQNYYSGKSALTFDGGDFLSNGSLPIQSNGMTIAVVFDETTRVAFAGLVVGYSAGSSDAGSSNAFRLSVHEGTNIPSSLRCAAGVNTLDAASPAISESAALGKQVIVVTVNPAAAANAVLRYSGSAGTPDTVYDAPQTTSGTLIGGRFVSGSVSALYRFNGRIMEIAIWNRALTLDEAKSVEQYANKKWGTSAI